ncbi:MAG: FtsX-like permease family protein [Candidatus Goldbacteria bacterium]|nr:FtsX-like permease family protein [Candidatus Goldiibacteriota bacterium]
MFIFLKIAFGNIIKNWRNSITVLIVVFVCVFTMQVGTGYIDGFKKKITSDFLKQIGHVNIYDEKYYKEQDFLMMEYNIPYNKEIIKKIKNIPGVKNIRPEINFGAIANTQNKNLQCMVKAIDIQTIDENYRERKSSIIEGKFIKTNNDFVLGYKAAKLLNIKTGENLILLTIDQYGSINAVEGRVCGLFKSNNAVEDESMVICGLEKAQKLLNLQDKVTVITVNFDDPFLANEKAFLLQKILPNGIIAVPWQTGQAFILNMLKLFNVMALAISFILIFAASMGIINSFLMNIMNRLPEFGVLRAMGLSKLQLFFMIITESFLLGGIGTIFAMLPGTIVVKYFETNPMNFEKIWKIMEGSGMGSMDASIGMVFVPASFIIVIMTGILISVIASIYPAMIALSKKPSDIMKVLE